MNTLAFLQKTRWVRMRAKRIQAFYGVSRAIAVYDANLDWIDFNFPKTATGTYRHA